MNRWIIRTEDYPSVLGVRHPGYALHVRRDKDPHARSPSPSPDVTQIKPVYNLRMTVFRYGREHFEEGEYVRRKDATPGDGVDPVVRIVEDLGTVEIPCGKVDCRSNCLEYMVRPTRKTEDYALAECKLSSLVSII